MILTDSILYEKVQYFCKEYFKKAIIIQIVNLSVTVWFICKKWGSYDFTIVLKPAIKNSSFAVLKQSLSHRCLLWVERESISRRTQQHIAHCIFYRKILFAYPIDGLCNWRQPKKGFIQYDTQATCLVYFNFFLGRQFRSCKKYVEYYLWNMQTINYAHDRAHFLGPGWVVPFDLWECVHFFNSFVAFLTS